MSNFISIGRLDGFPQQQSRSFECSIDGQKIDGFVVRQGNKVFAYFNQCPHTGAPLNWNPDQFLTRTGDLIQCSLHGALFEISGGKCVAGPCVGGSLSPIPLMIEGGEVLIDGSVLVSLGQR